MKMILDDLPFSRSNSGLKAWFSLSWVVPGELFRLLKKEYQMVSVDGSFSLVEGNRKDLFFMLDFVSTANAKPSWYADEVLFV